MNQVLYYYKEKEGPPTLLQSLTPSVQRESLVLQWFIRTFLVVNVHFEGLWFLKWKPNKRFTRPKHHHHHSVHVDDRISRFISRRVKVGHFYGKGRVTNNLWTIHGPWHSPIPLVFFSPFFRLHDSRRKHDPNTISQMNTQQSIGHEYTYSDRCKHIHFFDSESLKIH